MTSRPQAFATVEAGRALAALLVVLFHASALVASPRYWSTDILGGFFGWGHAGVNFFFVLSGFIIFHTHRADIGRPQQLGRFVRRRLTRIYPIYWLVLGGVLVLTWLPLGFHVPVGDPAVILSSILLVGPDNLATVVEVAWTLYHEMLFYMVFAVWIFSWRAGLLVTIIWLAAIAGGAARFGVLPLYVMSPLNLLFALGIAAWWLSHSIKLAQPMLLGRLGAAAFALIGTDSIFWHALSSAGTGIGFGLAAAVGLFGFVAAEREGPVQVPRVFGLLGAASYAIYLTHFPLLAVFARLLSPALRLGLAPGVAFAVLVALAVGVGVAIHLTIEQWLNRLVGRRGRVTAPSTSLDGSG